jgi:hypothetical protein
LSKSGAVSGFYIQALKGSYRPSSMLTRVWGAKSALMGLATNFVSFLFSIFMITQFRCTTVDAVLFVK